MKTNLIIAALALCFAGTAAAQTTDTPDGEGQGYVFTDTKVVPITPVKNQHRSGTCWCFSTISFLEGEILRTGAEAPHLSEMWVVRNAYKDKARKYVRMHGHINWAQGGAACDVTEGIKAHGIVPFEVYPGLNYGTDKPDFHELAEVLKSYLDTVIEVADRTSKPLSTAWERGFDALLDEYFGVMPETFTYNGKEYTPQSFAASLPIDINDYVSVGSYTHHPFHTQFILEVPDNWMWGTVYNVTLDEMMAIVDNTLANNYPIEWATDVSEKGFSRTKAIGIVPDEDIDGLDGSEAEKWGDLTDAEKEAALYKFDRPVKEKIITQEMRQTAFDNYETTDDHGMVIVGTAHDQAGNPFFKVLNSWDVLPPYAGYYYFSRPFVAYKTTSIIVNKNAIPKDIRNKLHLK